MSENIYTNAIPTEARVRIIGIERDLFRNASLSELSIALLIPGLRRSEIVNTAIQEWFSYDHHH